MMLFSLRYTAANLVWEYFLINLIDIDYRQRRLNIGKILVEKQKILKYQKSFIKLKRYLLRHIKAN